MAIAVESVRASDVSPLPEKLPSDPTVRLSSVVEESDLNPGELSRLHYGVQQAAEAIEGGRSGDLGLGFILRVAEGSDDYHIRHNGLSSVEGTVRRQQGPMSIEFVLLDARVLTMQE